MEKLLQKAVAMQGLIKRSLPVGPLHKWVEQHSIARELASSITSLLPCVIPVHRPDSVGTPQADHAFRAVAWNVDRGKKTDDIIAELQLHPDLKDADFLLLTETDWGMARSGNRDVTADIARALGMYAWFAPSYFNLTTGHGAERALGGENKYGLHGNSILSRYPLENLRVVKLKNATDKFRNVEVRLGQQTVLIGDFRYGNHSLTLACIHLDAYSSQRQRANQLKTVLSEIPKERSVLIGGDFNTSTYNAKHSLYTALGLIYKTLFFGPARIMRNHYVHPYKRFDRPVFRELEQFGYNYRDSNELGVGTFDIVLGDEGMRSMASDKFPRIVEKYVEWAIGLNGGACSTRLDWFATRNINPKNPKVVRFTKKLSDHYPIVLHFDAQY